MFLSQVLLATYMYRGFDLPDPPGRADPQQQMQSEQMDLEQTITIEWRHTHYAQFPMEFDQCGYHWHLARMPKRDFDEQDRQLYIVETWIASD
jgi:hypothetical protein